MAEGLGVPHTVEVSAIFGPDNTGGGPDSYSPGGLNAHIIPVIQSYWTSFIRSFDPNTFRLPDTAEWEAWNGSSQHRLLFQTGGNTTMEAVAEDARQRCKYLTEIGAVLKQ